MSLTSMPAARSKASTRPSGEKTGDPLPNGHSAEGDVTRRFSPVAIVSRKMLSTPGGEPLSTSARSLPSGDHETFPYQMPAGNHLADNSPSLRSGPPSAGMTKIPAPSVDRRRKAICRPSGDHVGLYSSASPSVRRSGGP